MDVRFLMENLWTEAGISASSEVTALPAAASQHPDRSYVWRSLNDVSDKYLTVTLGNSAAATMVGVANLRRLNAGAVILQQAGNGASPGAWADVVTLPDADPITRVTLAFFDTITAKHWRLKFENGIPATADYAEAGVVGLGEYYEPERRMAAQFDMPVIDPSVLTHSVDGQETGTARTQFTMFDVSFIAAPDEDHENLLALYRMLTVRTALFLSLHESHSWEWFYGRLRSPLNRRPIGGRQFMLSVGFEEAR